MGPCIVCIVSYHTVELCDSYSLKLTFIACPHPYFLLRSWLNKVTMNNETKTVDLSNVIAANGKHFILNGNRCGLCGRRSGYKTKCSTGRCHAHGEKNKPYHFHATCARQIGFEVAHYNEDDFVGKPFHLY